MSLELGIEQFLNFEFLFDRNYYVGLLIIKEFINLWNYLSLQNK